jgi:DNA (cytosine-5)-methyltransferase 1
MNYLSVCSGIEAATVAWHDLGFNPVGFSEIEKFPSQLLQHHYPHVTNYGDMTKYKEWNLNESIGLLVGGTPCQSFSVAGLRKGLEDPRGNLMLTYLGIAEKFKPKWLLWENVPGVLSSNGGEDFACLLKGMAELGYGFAYRVFDAQYFGVPQRRKRVFVVGCLGDWRGAAKVLFESDSLSRDITPSRQEGKEIANCIKASPSSYGSYNPARSEGNAVLVSNGVSAIDLKDVSKTLTASYGTGGADLDIKPLVLEPKTYNITFCDANGTRKDRPNGGLYVNETDTSNTLTISGVGTNAVHNMRVRRLTPMECERLQGFPDGYTHTPTSSDTTRYKALGNSMAVPVMRWIGKRISQV